MKLENGEWYLNDAARRMARTQPELIRRVGVTALGVAARATPPNRGGISKGFSAKAGRDALRNRIASEILGESVGGVFSVPTAIPNARGGVVPKSWRGPQISFGGYRFVEPREEGNIKVPVIDPEKVLRARSFYRRGNVVRARAPRLKGWKPRWIRSSDLLAAVIRRQKKAGSLVSGLLPAARMLKASGLSTFNLSKLPRRGWASLVHEGGVTELEMGNDWGALIVGSRFLPQLSTYVNSAAGNGIRNTENWFLKQVFG